MSHNNWQHAAHVVHAAMQTETGKKAVTTAVNTLATAAPVALAVAGVVASTVALPAAAIGALGYGLYRLFK